MAGDKRKPRGVRKGSYLEDDDSPPPKKKISGKSGRPVGSTTAKNTNGVAVGAGGGVLKKAGIAKPKMKAGKPKMPSQPAEDEIELYCVCQQPYDSRRFMIGCDKCFGWFHARCVNVTVTEAHRLKQFVCPPCRKEAALQREQQGKDKDAALNATRKAMAAKRKREEGMAFRPSFTARGPRKSLKRSKFRRGADTGDIQLSYEDDDEEASAPSDDEVWRVIALAIDPILFQSLFLTRMI